MQLLEKEILKHKHEKESGRSSSISVNHKIINDNAITFIDLCGHQKYLKSTVFGLSNSFSDYSMLVICMNRGITDITQQHLILSLSLIGSVTISNKPMYRTGLKK